MLQYIITKNPRTLLFIYFYLFTRLFISKKTKLNPKCKIIRNNYVSDLVGIHLDDV